MQRQKERTQRTERVLCVLFVQLCALCVMRFHVHTNARDPGGGRGANNVQAPGAAAALPFAKAQQGTAAAGEAQMRGGWPTAVLVLALGACSRTQPPDPAALIAIGPKDVRIDAAPVARSVSGQLLPPVAHVAGAAPSLNGQPA